MRAVLQRVGRAKVIVGDEIVGDIETGLLALIGVSPRDGDDDVEWLSRKVAHLKVFPDEAGRMSQSLWDIKGQILVVSQFTLLADLKKGRRPSFHRSAEPNAAKPLIESFADQLQNQHGLSVAQGQFGAHMKVELLNDGPVTLILDSHQKDF
jgi:D-tyrosyl-tRNA(Tyr) deacylase